MPADTPSSSSPGRPASPTPQRVGAGTDSDGFVDTAVVADPSAETAAGSPGERGKVESGAELLGSMLNGRYLVTRKIGQGGMGAVYEATHTLIGKRVAVKVLLEKYAQREAIVARLKKEAQLASSIGNEHIIDITDIGNTDDGRTFVVMEYLDGESLAECLAREHELPESRILRIASQAASALAAAHAKNIVHRDIKPENLFLLKRKDDEFVKVVDFGISKSLRATSEEEEVQRLTQTGMVLGTPLYMSPEQARGDEDLDHRVDIYALGVIIYEMIAGHVPFTGANYLSVISQVLNDEPPPLRQLRPNISEELEALIAKAMAKDRDQRYADANAMFEDLNALATDPTHSTERARITGPRRRFPRAAQIPRAAWAVGGIGLAVASVALAVVFLQGGPAKRAARKAPVAVVAVDASIPPKPVDAAEIKKITLHIETTPPGAIIERESELLGPAPRDVVIVVHDKEVPITAHLDGYDDATSMINPVEQHDGDHITLALKKLPKGAPQHPRPHAPTAPSTQAVPANTAGGELGGYPGAGGGTLPKK